MFLNCLTRASGLLMLKLQCFQFFLIVKTKQKFVPKNTTEQTKQGFFTWKNVELHKWKYFVAMLWFLKTFLLKTFPIEGKFLSRSLRNNVKDRVWFYKAVSVVSTLSTSIYCKHDLGPSVFSLAFFSRKVSLWFWLTFLKKGNCSSLNSPWSVSSSRTLAHSHLHIWVAHQIGMS